MTYFVEQAISIAEIAKVSGMTTDAVEEICRDAGIPVGEDWAGRPAVTSREAWLISSGQAAQRAETERTNISRQLLAERWTRDRNAAYRRAYDETFAENQRRPLVARSSDAVVLGVAQQAGRDAVAEFERTHPNPDQATPGLLARLVEAMR